MKPQRIQRSRACGWRMPADAVYVGRPSRWGNPFPWRGDWIVWAAVARGFRADEPGRIAAAVAFHREWLTAATARGPLAEEKSGGIIQYESGISLYTSEAARSIADVAAMILSGRINVPFPPSASEIIAELRGKHLACWCPVDQPCHADVLLEIANAPEVRP